MSTVPEGPLGDTGTVDLDAEPYAGFSDRARWSLFRTTNGAQGWLGCQGPQGDPRWRR